MSDEKHDLIFDTGGHLPPGISKVINRTDEPEPLMPLNKDDEETR